MPRLFVGLELSPECRMRLSLLNGGLEGARWITPENYHVTLRFIGDVDRHEAHEIDAQMQAVEQPPFSLCFSQLDAFGTRKPHAVYAGIVSSPELTRLQQDIARRIDQITGARDRRKFVPHVTLARIKSLPPALVAGYLAGRDLADFPASAVTRFVLYSARESVGGGPYGIEASYSLG